MKLGFVSAILPDQSIEEVFQIAAEIGYQCVEIMCWPVGKAERRYAGVTHINVNNLTSKKAASILDLSKKYGVEISGLGYYPNPLSSDEMEAEMAIVHLYRVIEGAKMLGLVNVNTFVGRNWKHSVEENWDQFLKVWKPIVQFAEKHDVKIGIENCPMLFTKDEWPGGKNLLTSPTIWKKAFSDLDSECFGLNFDPSHFIWQQLNIEEAIRDFGHKFYHVHAKDVRLDTFKLDRVGIMAFPNDYHTPKLPGLGDVNWNQFFSALTDAKYDGPVCVEVEDRAFEGSLEKRIESLKISFNYLRQFIP